MSTAPADSLPSTSPPDNSISHSHEIFSQKKRWRWPWWLSRSLVLLFCVGFFKEMKPSEPFLTPYLVDYKGLSNAQVNNEVYPVWTYSYLAVLVLVLLTTDLVRYTPVVLIGVLAYLTTRLLLLWASGLRAMQLMQFAYGSATAADIAYTSAIYILSTPTHFRKLTALSKATVLTSQTISGILAQLLVSCAGASLILLNYISLASVSMSVLCATVFMLQVRASNYEGHGDPLLRTLHQSHTSRDKKKGWDNEGHGAEAGDKLWAHPDDGQGGVEEKGEGRGENTSDASTDIHTSTVDSLAPSMPLVALGASLHPSVSQQHQPYHIVQDEESGSLTAPLLGSDHSTCWSACHPNTLRPGGAGRESPDIFLEQRGALHSMTRSSKSNSNINDDEDSTRSQIHHPHPHSHQHPHPHSHQHPHPHPHQHPHPHSHHHPHPHSHQHKIRDMTIPSLLRKQPVWREHMRSLWSTCCAAYTDRACRRWCVWWILATCVNLQVENYIQTLWEEAAPDRSAKHAYNGGVTACATCVGIVAALIAGTLNVGSDTRGELFLSLLSFANACALLIAARATSVWTTYAMYVVFAALFTLLITVVNGELARALSQLRGAGGNFAFVFGANMFFALVLQTILTAIVNTSLAMSVRPQFVVYGVLFAGIGVLFFLFALYQCALLRRRV